MQSTDYNYMEYSAILIRTSTVWKQRKYMQQQQ